MRRLLARYIIRRLWRLLADNDNPGYGTLGVKLNIISCVTTVLGGHSGWIPLDVKEDFKGRVGYG